MAILSCHMCIMSKSRVRAQTHRPPIVDLGFANRTFVGAVSVRPLNLISLDDRVLFAGPLRNPLSRLQDTSEIPGTLHFL